MKIYWSKSEMAWLGTNIKNSSRGKSTNEKPIYDAEDIAIKLLRVDGEHVCIPFLEAPICMVVNQSGKLLNPQKIYFTPRVKLNDCHNKSLRYWKRFPNKYQFVTGFTMTSNDKTWIRHSWLLEKNNIIVETTPIKRDKYFGFISDNVSAKIFCKIYCG